MGVWNAIECWFLQHLVLGIRSSVGQDQDSLLVKRRNDSHSPGYTGFTFKTFI